MSIRASYETLPRKFGTRWEPALFEGVVRHNTRVIWRCKHEHKFAHTEYFADGQWSAKVCAELALSNGFEELGPQYKAAANRILAGAR